VAVTVTLDSVQNTAADIDVIGTTGEILRGGWVDGLEGDPSSFLAQCFAAVNAEVLPGTPFPGTGFPYRRLQVRPDPSGDSASVVLVYTLQGGGSATAYEISTRRSCWSGRRRRRKSSRLRFVILPNSPSAR
jgi:hypothetical protein